MDEHNSNSSLSTSSSSSDEVIETKRYKQFLYKNSNSEPYQVCKRTEQKYSSICQSQNHIRFPNECMI